MLKEGNETGVVGQPKDLGERIILATQCVSQYKLTLPMVLDGMDGKVNRDYQAAPVRVTVVDIDGKVVFYAGRGPADFRIPPVERTLKKLVANDGRMPPPPPFQWGEPVMGLSCGLSFDPSQLSGGEDVVVRMAFRNTADAPITLRHDPVEAARNLSIRNEQGQPLRMRPITGARQLQARRFGDSGLVRIEPAQTVEIEIEGTISSPSRRTSVEARLFRAVYRFENTEGPMAETPSLWTGKVDSGVCSLQVSPPARQESDPNAPPATAPARRLGRSRAVRE